MNYLCKSIISTIENQIYYTDSFELGVIIGERIKLLSDNNVEGCDHHLFLEGIKRGFQRADIKEITKDSDERN